MSLDVYLMKNIRASVYSQNITHNLGPMAKEAGIYMELWRPDEMAPPLRYARELIAPLKEGLRRLELAPDKFRALNPENGWGTYEGLVKFVKQYIAACEDHPDAEIEVSR